MADKTSTQKRKPGRPRTPYTSGVARVPTPLMPSVLGMVAEFRQKALAEARQQRKTTP